MKATNLFYWTTFGLSLAILLLNLGLFLVGAGIVILAILILHLIVGLNLSMLEKNKTGIILSGLNLFTFALIRPDGVHTISNTGLSAVLELFGIYIRFSDDTLMFLFATSLFLLLVQVVMDVRLRKYIRRAKRKGA